MSKIPSTSASFAGNGKCSLAIFARCRGINLQTGGSPRRAAREVTPSKLPQATQTSSLSKPTASSAPDVTNLAPEGRNIRRRQIGKRLEPRRELYIDKPRHLEHKLRPSQGRTFHTGVTSHCLCSGSISRPPLLYGRVSSESPKLRLQQRVIYQMIGHSI